MRVLHVIPSLEPSYGGPSTVLPIMCRALVRQGLSVDVASIRSQKEAANDPPPALERQPDGYSRITFPVQITPFRVSLPLGRWLRAHVKEYDAVHVHAVFTYSSMAACRASAAAGVPFIVRPLGILNSWGMENRRRRLKKLWFKFLEKPLLDQAARIHYTSEQERDDAARLAIRAPALVQPLALDLSQFDQLPAPHLIRERFPETGEKLILLYLSRIHQKKGFDLLLPAFAAVKKRIPEICLMVAGDGEASFLESLRAETKRLKIERDVIWTGFMGPRERLEALAGADIFCLPSWSENFGVALLEAMAAGLPCIATDQVALATEAARSGAVIETTCDPVAIENAIITLSSNEVERHELGRHGALYAREHHDISAVSVKLKALYEAIARKPS